jgi:YfiH family protein
MWRISRGWCRNMALEDRCGVFLGVTTRGLGNMKDPQALSRVLGKAGITQSWAGGKQVHGRRVRVVRRSTAPLEFSSTDGLTTNVPRLALRVFAADCVPVFLMDPRARAAALVHAGWRGTHKRILTRAIAAMRKAHGSRPSDLWAALGPHIQSCCYEVGTEVAGNFQRTSGAIFRRRGRFFLDLGRALQAEALQAGVRKSRFLKSPYCTCHDRRFHSYRRNKTEKRMAAVVMIKNSRLSAFSDHPKPRASLKADH